VYMVQVRINKDPEESTRVIFDESVDLIQGCSIESTYIRSGDVQLDQVVVLSEDDSYLPCIRDAILAVLQVVQASYYVMQDVLCGLQLIMCEVQSKIDVQADVQVDHGDVHVQLYTVLCSLCTYLIINDGNNVFDVDLTSSNVDSVDVQVKNSHVQVAEDEDRDVQFEECNVHDMFNVLEYVYGEPEKSEKWFGQRMTIVQVISATGDA